MNETPKQLRGFAKLSPAARREIARRGGRAAQESGRGHIWSDEEARAAGKRGGLARAAKQKVA